MATKQARGGGGGKAVIPLFFCGFPYGHTIPESLVIHDGLPDGTAAGLLEAHPPRSPQYNRLSGPGIFLQYEIFLPLQYVLFFEWSDGTCSTHCKAKQI